MRAYQGPTAGSTEVTRWISGLMVVLEQDEGRHHAAGVEMSVGFACDAWSIIFLVLVGYLFSCRPDLELAWVYFSARLIGISCHFFCCSP